MKFLLFFFLINFFGKLYANEINIKNPKGGWRDSSSEKIIFSQKINYPYSSVSMQNEQPNNGRIEGEIYGDIENSKKPLKLIVNGNPMPLQVENSKFSRPYSFGNGSNNIEVRSDDGKISSKVQFYDVKKGGTQSRIRVILSWDSNGTDLDLHVIDPAGKHCYYSNRILSDGSALDIDVTTGYGPEIFASPGILKGPYLIYVNYYANHSDTGEITVASVSIITNEGTEDEKVETKRVPLRHPGELNFISSFIY